MMPKFFMRKSLAIAISAFVFSMAMVPGKSFANVTVTPASPVTVYACGGTFPTSYTTLSNIVIAEGSNGDFAVGANKTLILTAPSNFNFNVGVGNVGITGNNISNATISVTSTTITVTYTIGAASKLDVITISNIQVKGINTASGPSNILRTAANPGTATIAGIVNGSTNFGTLTSQNQTIPSVTTSASQSSCSGSATNIALTSSPSGASFTWTLGTVTNVTGASACASSCGTTIAQTLTSPANPSSVQYIVTPTLNTCAGTPFTITNTVNLVSSGTLNAIRDGGRCGVRIDGTPVTCPDGSTAIYSWYYKKPGSGPDTLMVGETGEDLFPSGNASRYKYRRVATCGSCSASYSLQSPIAAYMLVTISSTNVKCLNSRDGTATATITGGTSPFSYTWSTGATTSTITGLDTGTYSITIKDSFNCNANASVTITQPASLPSAAISGTALACNGGSSPLITFTGSGGTPPYTFTYNINGGANTTTTSGSTVTISASTRTSGTFTYNLVSVTDANSCVTSQSGSATITIDPRPTSVLSGSQIICNGNSATLTVVFTGTPPWSLTYSDGTTSTTVNNINTNPYTFIVSPSSTKTYTITALNDSKCAAQAPDRAGSATVTVPSGAQGVWTGAFDNDWFNCRNWSNGLVPTTSDTVFIPNTPNLPQINGGSSYAASYAQCKKLTVNNSTLSFVRAVDTLFTTGDVIIQNSGIIDMSVGGRLELQGNWSDQVANGFVPGTGSVVFSGANTQTLSSVNSPELFYNFEINKTAATQQLNLLVSITVNHDLTLTKGIITTDNKLFTWNKGGGGSLTAPNIPWVTGQSNHSDSYIATCTAGGSPLSFTKPYNGSFGFNVLSIGGNNDVYFPVGADLKNANRMSLNMNNSVAVARDFAIVVGKGDIGNTIDPRVNRIWYVNASDTTGVRATMKLFFTKSTDFINWPSPQDEIEPPFPYVSVRLIQKNYDSTYFINQSTGADIQSGWAGVSTGTEVFGLYTRGVSEAFDLSKNGITQFNEFSIIEGSSIILPVTITNIKAWQDGTAVKIAWTSAQEINIDHYEIETATDAQHFIYLGTVPAKNNGLTADYQFTDKKPATGNNYYRIKVVDKNSAISYTSIVVVNIGRGIAKVLLYPNPALKHTFNLQLSNADAGNYQLQVFDDAGRIIVSKKIEHFGGSSTQQIILPAGIAAGAYRVVLLRNDRAIYNTTLVVAD